MLGIPQFKESNKEKETFQIQECHVGGSCETSSGSGMASTLDWRVM